MSKIIYESELCHHGIKGQRWGVRRFQNADGTYTKAGIMRYATNGQLRKIDRKIHTVRGKEKALGTLELHALTTAEASNIYKKQIENLIHEVSQMKLSDYNNDPRWEYSGDGNDRKGLSAHRKETLNKLQRSRDEMERFERGWNKVLDFTMNTELKDIHTGDDLVEIIDRAFNEADDSRKKR